MGKLAFLKNWKILLWILLVLASISFIGLNLNPQGLVVTSKTTNSTAPLAVGEILYFINGQPATQELVSQKFDGLVRLATNKGEKFFRTNDTLGVSAKSAPSSNLKFGLDIEGGIRTVLALNDSANLTVEQTLATLQTRINLYGLREANLRPVTADKKSFVEISIAGGTREEIQALLERQGHFEARIPLLVALTDGKGSFEFDKKYEITARNGSVTIDGEEMIFSSTRDVGDVRLTLNSATDRAVNFTSLAFSSDDITLVYFDPQRSGVQSNPSGGYRWFFQVQLTQRAAERFASITKNLERSFSAGGEAYLSSPLQLYLDNELVDTLNIVADLKGRVITDPSVTGFGATLDEAVKSQRRLQTILRSGELPTRVEVVSMEVISPRLGTAFIGNIMLALGAAIAAVIVVVSVRYRRKSVVIPMLVTALSEVVLILGASVAIGWTIDLASVAAILAIVGTGIDAQIILIDQAIRGSGEEILTTRERLKRALFMIFGSGGTAIGAMIPLMILGLGMLRGFAITTIVGVLIGIFITRPAFGEMITRLVKTE
jgi:preprotein translocase subunit SecD